MVTAPWMVSRLLAVLLSAMLSKPLPALTVTGVVAAVLSTSVKPSWLLVLNVRPAIWLKVMDAAWELSKLDVVLMLMLKKLEGSASRVRLPPPGPPWIVRGAAVVRRFMAIGLTVI